MQGKTLKIRCGKDIATVTYSRIITLPAFPGIKFIAHRDHNWQDWSLSEYSTGCKVGGGSTIQKAIKNLKRIIEHRDVDYLLKCVKYGQEKYGIINLQK